MMEEQKRLDQLKERLYRLVGLRPSSKGVNHGSDASVASLTILGRRLIGENGTCNYQEEEDLVRLKRWFVIACLETLGDLASAVPRVLPPDGIPTFGSKDLQAMALLVALIALWGLGPSLAGKGLASLGLGALAQKLSFPNPDASVSVQMPQDWLLLAQVCTTLHGVITAISPLETSPGHLVLHHHLIPTLAGFLTLGYGTCDDVDVAVWTKARNQLESILAEEKTIPLTSLFTALLALYGKQQAPVWLRTACGSYLSEALSRDNGVSALLRVFLSRSAAKAGSAGAGTSHLDEGTVAAISRILLSPPKHDSKQKDYFENLTRQLRALLLSDQPAMASVSGTLCLQLLYKRPEAGQRLIVDPILQPIMSLVWTKDLQPGASSSSDVDLDGNPILVTEEDLESRLIQLQCLLVEAKASTILTRLLAPAVPSLYFLYQFVSSGTSGLKTALQDLMTLLFRVAEEAVALDFLKSLAMVPTIDTINMVNGPSGGVALSWSSSPIQRELNMDVFMNLLGTIESQDVIAQLFLALLELNFGLQEHDVVLDSPAAAPDTRILHLNLILAMMQKYGAKVLQNIKQVLSFVKNVLATRDVEVLPLGLALLVTLLSNEEESLDKDCHFQVEEILVYLRERGDIEDEDIRAMVKEVQQLIIARKKPIKDQELDEISNSKFQEALKALGDPLLPIRAYGLNILRTMILCKDTVAIEKLDLILTIFLEQLEDSDSFIYLNAVKGLASLTDVFPMETLKRIVERYVDETVFTLDYRLRVGEVMMDTIERSGTSFAKYGKPILESICKVLYDEKKEMRSSAMSCLATIAQTAPLSLLPYLYQLMDYFTNLLILEKSVETRRAALYNFAALIQGLDATIFSTLPRVILNRMQVQLEYAADSESDALSRSHAQTAVDHMNSLLFDYLELHENS